MKEIVLLFPGQGSQYVGMGKRLEMEIKKADEVLNFSLSKLMFEGPLEELTLTQHAQPAILVHSLALKFKLDQFLNDNNLKVSLVLGHSLGEYSALTAGGVLSYSDAIKAVYKRGQLMEKAVPAGIGAMYAILKLDPQIIEKACQEVSTQEKPVMPANFNGPFQVVISGEKSACLKAIEKMGELSQQRVRSIELKVSAPFHSLMMKSAALSLGEYLKTLSISANKISYIANVDANLYPENTDPKIIEENLVKQVYSSVLWTQSISKLSKNSLCIEVGPGKVLAGLVKGIRTDIPVISLDEDEYIENAFKKILENLK